MQDKLPLLPKLMPVLFVAHGAPMLLDDTEWMGQLGAWARTIPRPHNIVMISAHWEQQPITIGATRTVPLVYDFSGFPEHYYHTQYPAPGAPVLAQRVCDLLQQQHIAVGHDAKRGLDHGAYVPLIAMYPAADVPVLQLSMPSLEADQLVAVGRALAPLRGEGTLIIGSGFLTHNMRYAFRSGIPQWAQDFDHWVSEALTHFDLDALCDFQRQAPSVQVALPTWEHYAPLLVAAGAVTNANPVVSFPIMGWWMNSAFTKRSVQFD